MGIDLLDVAFRVERTFRIRISREDAVSVFSAGTVGPLYAYIVYRLDQNEWPRGCLGVPVFYRLRRALVDLFGTPEERITPSSRLEEVLPLHQRRVNWQRLRKALDLPLPPLRRPAWIKWLIRCGSIALCLLGVLAFIVGNPAGDPVWLLLGLLLGSALKYGTGYLLTIPCAICFPASCTTVKALIKVLLRSDYGRIATRERMWHELEVWHALEQVLVESLNVKPEDVVPDAHLVNDLGAS